MAKNYQVEIECVVTVVVIGASDDDEAIEIAMEEVSSDVSRSMHTATAHEINDGELESYKPHADHVAYP